MFLTEETPDDIIHAHVEAFPRKTVIQQSVVSKLPAHWATKPMQIYRGGKTARDK
jgi:hypothetical protein